jgi:4-aminobutyrate aminotransferase-like enzyme
MIGMEFPDGDTARAVEQACFRRGVVMLTAGPASIRLAPALVITRHHIDIAVGVLDDALTAIGG